MKKKKNLKIWIGAGIILAALIYLLVSSTLSQSQYFLTVEELQTREAELIGKNVRMSGAVIGETIQYDPQSLKLSFDVAQIPGDHKLIQEMGGMAKVLNQAANDPTLPRVRIFYEGVRPDLLKHETQAILTGALQADGTFSASEILLKCPSKYEAQLPEQSE